MTKGGNNCEQLHFCFSPVGFLQKFALFLLVFSADYFMHIGQLEFGPQVKKKKKKDCFRSENLWWRLGRQIITFRAGFTAVPWQQDGIVTVQVWAVLFDVLTVYFPKHLAATALLLPEERNKETDTSVAHEVSCENFCLSGTTDDDKFTWSWSEKDRDRSGDKTYRIAVTLDAVHDTEGLPQVRVPRVLQRVEPTSK